jgi:hypothetical protein
MKIKINVFIDSPGVYWNMIIKFRNREETGEDNDKQ